MKPDFEHLNDGASEPVAAFEAGGRVPTADRSQEELLHKFCADFAEPIDKALEIFEWFDEHMPTAVASKTPANKLYYTVALERIFREILACENLYLGTVAMIYSLAAVYPGLDDLIGNKNPSQIAVEYGKRNGGLGCHRMNVTKLVNRFQKNLSLPKRTGQKTSETCKKLSDRRNENLRREG